jgi:NAD(P)-dependent dehydrogenase (short-subunit alcohol dehydrogenase family)
VTGGASGIGRAQAERFAAEGAKRVVIADQNAEWAQKIAERIGGVGVACDVGDARQVEALVARTEAEVGPIDIFCSNAGYSDRSPGDLTSSVEAFERITRVNLLAHVWAAKAVLPGMIARGGGYLLQTVSSAALITGPSGAGYTFTKHGALGFAEWVSLRHGDEGIRVSCLCPNAVYTGMFGRPLDEFDPKPLPKDHPIGEILLPEDVAKTVLEAMKTTEPFLILPHARVGASFKRKGEDYEGWMRHTRARLKKFWATART